MTKQQQKRQKKPGTFATVSFFCKCDSCWCVPCLKKRKKEKKKKKKKKKKKREKKRIEQKIKIKIKNYIKKKKEEKHQIHVSLYTVRLYR